MQSLQRPQQVAGLPWRTSLRPLHLATRQSQYHNCIDVLAPCPAASDVLSVSSNQSYTQHDVLQASLSNGMTELLEVLGTGQTRGSSSSDLTITSKGRIHRLRQAEGNWVLDSQGCALDP